MLEGGHSMPFFLYIYKLVERSKTLSQHTRGGTVWQQQMRANRDQLLSWQSAVHFNGVSASGQFKAAELIRNMIAKPQWQQTDRARLMLLQMSGDVHPNTGPITKYPFPLCAWNVTSRGVSYKCIRCSGWVHAKCSGLLNAAQYRIKSDWTCSTCSAPSSQQSPPPTPSPPLSHAPSSEQISDTSTFKILQLKTNGIENEMTELGVVLERNKVKVAVIQESKLSPKSRTPASVTTPQCVRTVLMIKVEDCWS